MKGLIVTDTHLGLYSDSDAWLEIVLDFYKHIIRYCVQNRITKLYHLGDFFDNRKSLNTKTQHTAHRIARVLAMSKDLHTYIIVGNHDCYYKNKIHPNTLELFLQYDHITVVDEPTVIEDALLVPWGFVPKKEDSERAKYCFGHFAINGFHMNDSVKCKKGIDDAQFQDFEKVLSGHFHTPSSNKNIVYLGAPYGQTFHDAGGSRGYHLFEDGKLDFIEYEDAPKFMKVYSSSDFGKDITGNIVKLIFEEDYGTTKNQDIVDSLLGFNPFLYSVDFTRIRSQEDQELSSEDIGMESKEKIVDQYIDAQVFPTNINIPTLKAMFMKMMQEAGQGKTKIRDAAGAKIECISVGFQNFLTFGSQWQEIPLNKGVNFVTGRDADKGKSNGAGKSSFLETIPFALFGKTARDIKQNQIINWKNKKNCQVVFKFKINNDIYEISRQLKPNKLAIYKNGDLIDQDAHKTDYQNMFEDIFGMDVKMFMSLIHSNVNGSANILNMTKAEKRRFLERMFGLIIYSDMNKICNDKLRDIEQKKYRIETTIESANDKIESAKQMKVKFREEINSKKSSIENVDEIKEQLDKLIEDYPNIDNDIDKVNEDIKAEEDKFNNIKIEYERVKATELAEIGQIKRDIQAIDDIKDQIKANEVIQAKIDKIVEKAGDLDKISADINEATEEQEKQNALLDDANKASLKVYKEMSELDAELKSKQKSMDLLADGKCPTCGADTSNPVADFKKDIASIKRKHTNRKKKYTIYTDDASIHQESASQALNRVKLLQRTKDTLNDLKGKIKDVETGKDKDELVTLQRDKEANLVGLLNDYMTNEGGYSSIVGALNRKRDDLKAEKLTITSKQREYDIAVSQAEEIKRHVKSLTKMIEEQDAKIVKIKEEIKDFDINMKKLNSIKDYINAIKFILKDENIKQFTIKQIMPFINKQTNGYLSEVNYGFYVNIDKWLDVEVKGPGIRNASYGSLSGGEKRGIDIAIQLSLIDVARTQSGIFPDLLVFDELLDSSIDSRGINELMKIVKTKQKEFDGKVFVITHRPEVDGELVDNEYKVVKQNGYSKVYV